MLVSTDLWCYIEGSYETQKGEKAGEAKVTAGKNQARAIMICNVGISIVPLIMMKTDPKEIWETLEQVNKSKCLAAKQILRSKLFSRRMKKGQTIRQLANEICMLETELLYANHTTVNEDKRFVLLNGLRAEFSVKMEIQQEKDLSFEEIVSALEVTEN